MSLLKEFTDYIQRQNLFQRTDYLLLAVSGGIDSVALCELCFQAGFRFEIAHCNFQLRGEESDRDEQFVRKLAEQYSVKVFVKEFDTNRYAEEHKISIQVAARELRYQWFDELLNEASSSNWVPEIQQQGFSSGQDRVPVLSSRQLLLTAHHANDNIETLLMNFFKGTGIKGLQGILPKQGKIIRPLLFAKREEIRSFLKENNLDFVEDSSNVSEKYTRNYFRHQLIPAIEKVYPSVEDNLINNLGRFKEIEILYRQAVQLHKKKLLEYKGNEIHIPILKLLKRQPLKTLVHEIITDFGFTAHQTDEVIHLLYSDSGKYISSSTHKIIKNRNWLIIAPVNNLTAAHILIHETDTEIQFEAGTLRLKHEVKIGNLSTSNLVATLDAAFITYPLLLRKWKQGDYFYPLGMRKKKKLSKFFIDQKMSLTEKENSWVIESDQKILWVIGKRIDDRFKITANTKKALSIQLI